jgi:tRNA pseudouridine13 synthase
MSAKSVKAEALSQAVNHCLVGLAPLKPHFKLNRRLLVGNFSYNVEPVRLGDARGNRFQIVIRDAEGDPAPGFEAISRDGFVNYFGLQRFGVSAVPTSAVGKALFAKDWAAAVDLILRPREGMKEEDEMTEMRKQWAQTKHAGRSLACLPKRGRFPSTIEFQLLDRLRKAPGDYYAALGAVSTTSSN